MYSTVFSKSEKGKSMSDKLHTVQKLIGNPVIGITNGKAIAKVADIRIDPKSLKAVLAVTSRGGLFKGDVEAIQADKVKVWGQDALLVEQPDVVVKEDELNADDDWLSGSEDIRGYDVVTEDGTRIGTLADLVLDHQGQIQGYRMSEVFIEGNIAESYWVDVEATHSLGPDVLIVKSEIVNQTKS
jgi:uncharacterized protein YrrD